MGQLANIVLSFSPLRRKSGEVTHIPQPHQELQDISIISSRVHAQALSHRREVVKEAGVAAVVQEVRRHGDLVALLVGGDGAADFGEFCVAVMLSMLGCVAVRYVGRPLLKRSPSRDPGSRPMQGLVANRVAASTSPLVSDEPASFSPPNPPCF
nr:Os02g0504850 [Ipomoea batatas]